MNPITHIHPRTLVALSTMSLMLSAGGTIAQSASQPEINVRVDTVITEPQIDFIMPQRRVGSQYITNISAVEVDVRLTDTLATTHIDITVVNNGSRTSQARLVLPVPDGSTIRSFGIDGLGDEPTAKLLPREEATRRYNEIVRKMIDPGLLEFVGNAMIQSSVFPVEPGESRTMTIVYEQTLDAHRGRVEYVLPRSASYNNSSINWTMNINLESVGSLGPVFSPSHPIVSKITGKQTMKVAVPMLDEPGAFRLYAVLGSEEDATTLLYPDPNDPDSGYFMFIADAPEIDASTETIPREITIVIDRSGSMNGVKIEQARESAKQIVQGMKMGEYVHTIDYSEDIRSFSDHPVEITKETLAAIIQYINNIQSRGGTNLHGALMEALASKVTQGHLPMVLFLTDGLASTGVTGEREIRAAAQKANTHERRVFTFGIGFDVNVPLLDGLAMDTRAQSTFVLPNEDVEMKVGQVFDKLDGPVMIEPIFGTHYETSCDTNPQLLMMEPSSLGDLFSGSRVVVLGQYKNLAHEPAHMWIRSSVDPQEDSITIQADFFVEDASTRYAFIARLWAQKRMDSLINQIRLAGASGSAPNTELVDEIVRLSLEHGILSEYTAFLAEEELGLEVANARTDDGRLRVARKAAARAIDLNAVRSGRGAMSQYASRQNADAVQIQADMDEQGVSYGYTGIIQSDSAVKANKYMDSNMNQVVITTVQRGVGATLYKKQDKWVDAKLGEQAGEEPEITIEFDTEEYWAIITDLVSQDRQWILANRGDVYFMNHSKRVLVRNPK
ncbi:MAG: VWA domain-containing protein [Phycisphaerales bacterium]|nr:VWA domain-containing protein [Phycisphaerales bacterium]